MQAELDLLKRVLFGFDDRSGLGLVKDKAKDILGALEREEFTLTYEEQAQLEQHASWVAEVYSMLGEEITSAEVVAAAEVPSEIARVLENIRNSESLEIGTAFGQLVDGLPAWHRPWEDWQRLIAPADDAIKKYLVNDQSIIAAQGHSEELRQFGLSPLMIHEVIQSLQRLFDRIYRAELRNRDQNQKADWYLAGENETKPFKVSFQPGEVLKIRRELVRAQASGPADIPVGASGPVFDWFESILPIRPWLVNGYYFEPESRVFMRESSVGMHANQDHPGSDLLQRWTRRPLPPRPDVDQRTNVFPPPLIG